MVLPALAWIMLRWARLRQAAGQPGLAARRDFAVGLALAASWLAVWGLYCAYYWTANAVGHSSTDVVVLSPPASVAVSCSSRYEG